MLAEGISGSEDQFVALMNQTAAKLGMTHSHFMNATGWPADGHVMSARDIATQFLMEAVILSLLGGGTGMLLGILVVLAGYGVVSSLLGPAPIPWLIIVAVATGFSVLVGVVFGTYPAIRAGKLDPIEALRS